WKRLGGGHDATLVLRRDLRHLLLPPHPAPAAPEARPRDHADLGQEGRSGGDLWRAARHGGRPHRANHNDQGGGLGQARLRPVGPRSNRDPPGQGARQLRRKTPPLGIGIVIAVIALSVWYLSPPRRTVNLGLDLQGGIHLVMGVDVDKALAAQLDREADTVRAELEKKGIGVSKIERRGSTELAVQLASPHSWNEAQNVFREQSGFEVKEPDQAAGRAVLAIRPREITALRDLAVRQALETIRNRIDQFGVSEPSIQQQGENRILVQLPGVQDPERAKALIGKTALLEFKLVDDR